MVETRSKHKLETATANTGGVLKKPKPSTAAEMDTTRSGLMKLPPELRLDIYEFVFAASKQERSNVLQNEIHSLYTLSYRALPQLFAFGLMQTNQLIRREITPLFVNHLVELSTDLFADFETCATEHLAWMDSSWNALRYAEDYEDRATKCLQGIEKASSVLRDLDQHDADEERILKLKRDLAGMKHYRESIAHDLRIDGGGWYYE